ncbi:hypothetical protein BT63DRAFT_424971 [Microthyrium microscopicum]|uniref:Uncharacterized protein n=1 Tax=Microthyrium microscopicum TaxID=703497 RepID=A0A6A6UCZ0_9PEZI|nr:hypothetical protein BT63DRAFT_424971 [Microthyrium microscopicum]
MPRYLELVAAALISLAGPMNQTNTSSVYDQGVLQDLKAQYSSSGGRHAAMETIFFFPWMRHIELKGFSVQKYRMQWEACIAIDSRTHTRWKHIALRDGSL